MLSRLLLIASLASASWSVAVAGETPPTPAVTAPKSAVVLLDRSRSTGDEHQRDRMQLLVDGLLADRLPGVSIHAFDRAVAKFDSLQAAGPFTSRTSDYLAAFRKALKPVAGGDAACAVFLLGDGRIDVVDRDPPVGDEYIKLTGGNEPTRTTINQAVTRLFLQECESVADSKVLRWVLVDTLSPGPDRASPVLDWLSARRTDAVRLPARELNLASIMTLLRKAGIPAKGRPLAGGDAAAAVLSLAGGATQTLSIPEGCRRVEVLANASGKDAAYGLEVSAPAPATVEKADDAGVARRMLVKGIEAGGFLSVKITGKEPAYEVLVLVDVAIQHRMALLKPADARALFTGDAIPLEHRFARPDSKPASGALVERLVKGMDLQLDDKMCEQAPVKADKVDKPVDGLHLAVLTLPSTAGDHTLVAQFKDPDVSSAPITFQIAVATDLRLTGGFSRKQVFEGGETLLAFAATGGRRTHGSIAVGLTGPSGKQRSIDLATDPAHPDIFQAKVRFESADRGAWSVDAQQTGPENGKPGEVFVAGLIPTDAKEGVAERRLGIEVVWDWRLPALIALILLLLALAAFLWWWFTRPRWGEEMLLQQGADRILAQCPGPSRRDSSYGVPDFQKALVFRRTRQGVTVATIGQGATLFVNGQKVADGSVTLAAGNDVELVGPTGTRVHCRFFASPAERGSWTNEQAQIDLNAFESPHFVLMP